jgi:hypothetical protein
MMISRMERQKLEEQEQEQHHLEHEERMKNWILNEEKDILEWKWRGYKRKRTWIMKGGKELSTEGLKLPC